MTSSDSVYRLSDPKQKKFIAWQTWDLQLITTYGFKAFSEYFIDKYENNFFIAPKRINGSAIETLFSQFKYTAGSKLSSLNYAVK